MSATAFCPNCGGNGDDGHPFDGNCPAAWAHQYVGKEASLLLRHMVTRKTTPRPSGCPICASGSGVVHGCVAPQSGGFR